MNRSRFGDLEVLVRMPDTAPRPTPLLFIHGAYAAAWCWEEHFMPWFASQGYACYALSLSGHGRSRGGNRLDSLGIADYEADLRETIEALPAKPVLIGHSMGGLVVQKYLEAHPAPAVVLMASVPPQGLWASALSLAFRKPGLMQELNSLLGGGRIAPEALRDALFAQPIDDATLQRHYLRMQPESFRAIWDMTLFQLPHVSRMHRPPTLVLGAEHDQLIPESLVHLTARSLGLEAEIFPGMGHGMMLEQDWNRVAVRVRDWLAETGY